MVSNVFVVDQAVKAYNLYLKIQVSICTRGADARGHTYNPLKIQDFTPFSETLGISMEMPSISKKGEKNLISKFLI